MNSKLAVVEEGRVAALVGALVLQLAGVHHRLVSPETVPCPVFFPAKRADVQPVRVQQLRIRSRIVRIISVREMGFPVFPEGHLVLEHLSAAVKVANVLPLVDGLDVRPKLERVLTGHYFLQVQGELLKS